MRPVPPAMLNGGAARMRVASRRVTSDFPAVPIVDCHVHLYPPEINRATHAWAAQAGEEVWAALCTRRRRDGRPVQGFPGVDELLRAMDDAGVARAILLGWYWHTPAACVLQNRFYAECVRAHPDRLSAAATVQPAAVESAREELRRAGDAGFVGIGELSPHGTGLPSDDGRWHEVLALAGELALPVTVHATDPDSLPYAGRVDTPLPDFLGWARRHPQTNFVLAHGGGRLPWVFPEARDLSNVVYDTAAFPLLYPAATIGAWLRDVGPDKLLWGTDWPLHLYPLDASRATMRAFREELDALDLTPETRVALMEGNARRVFNLPAR